MLSRKATYTINDVDVFDNGSGQYFAFIGDEVYMTRSVGDKTPTGWFMVFEYVGERKDYENQLVGKPITVDELPLEASKSLQYVLNDKNEDENLEYEESLSDHGDLEGVLEDLMKKGKKVRALDIDTMYAELINASQSTAILAENALKQYQEHELGAQLAQSALELIDRLDEVHAWVSKGGPLPGQVQETTQQTATAMIHLATAVDYLNNLKLG
jgi:hypothetical protein